MVPVNEHDSRCYTLEASLSNNWVQNNYTTAWKIKTNYQWDLIDRKMKKFIEVNVSDRNPNTNSNETLKREDLDPAKRALAAVKPESIPSP